MRLKICQNVGRGKSIHHFGILMDYFITFVPSNDLNCGFIVECLCEKALDYKNKLAEKY